MSSRLWAIGLLVVASCGHPAVAEPPALPHAPSARTANGAPEPKRSWGGSTETPHPSAVEAVTANPTEPVLATEPPDDVRWATRSDRCAKGQALSEDDHRILDYFAGSTLSVLRVSPTDTLHIRRHSSPTSESLAKLDFQESDLNWAGGACRVAGSTWLEIEWKGIRGWVNSYYAQPATPERDETLLVMSWLGPSRARSLKELTKRLSLALSRQTEFGTASPEAPLKVTHLGTKTERALSVVVFVIDNNYNDSVAGSQVLAVVKEDARGFLLDAVKWRDICLRGTAELCP